MRCGQSSRMRIRQVVTALVGGLALLGMSGCASWEAKLDQRSQVEKIPRGITQLTDHPIQTIAA